MFRPLLLAAALAAVIPAAAAGIESPESQSPTAAAGAAVPESAASVTDSPTARAGDAEEGQDSVPAAESPTAGRALDLRALGSDVLARLAGSLTAESDVIWYDSESGDVAEDEAAGAWRVEAGALYAELARRLARDEDKVARTALSLADLRKDARATEARRRAFEDKLADAVIAQLEAAEGPDKAKAQADLEALASQGNARARAYLGLDAPADAGAPAAAAAAPLSPTAGSGDGEAQPQPLSPAASDGEPARAGPGDAAP